MTIIKNLNYSLAFLLELMGLIVAGIWAKSLSSRLWLQILAVVLIVSTIMLIWGIYAAPSSRNRLTGIKLILFKIVIFGLITYFLYTLGHGPLALIFSLLVLLNLSASVLLGTL